MLPASSAQRAEIGRGSGEVHMISAVIISLKTSTCLHIRYEIVTFQKYFWLRKTLKAVSILYLFSLMSKPLLFWGLFWASNESVLQLDLLSEPSQTDSWWENCLQKILAQLHRHIPLRDHKILSVPQECCQGEKDYLAVPQFWTTWWAGEV